jgi:hypothetical protein
VVSNVPFDFELTLNAYDEHINQIGWVSTSGSVPGQGLFKGFMASDKQGWIAKNLSHIHFWTRHFSLYSA